MIEKAETIISIEETIREKEVETGGEQRICLRCGSSIDEEDIKDIISSFRRCGQTLQEWWGEEDEQRRFEKIDAE